MLDFQINTSQHSVNAIVVPIREARAGASFSTGMLSPQQVSGRVATPSESRWKSPATRTAGLMETKLALPPSHGSLANGQPVAFRLPSTIC